VFCDIPTKGFQGKGLPERRVRLSFYQWQLLIESLLCRYVKVTPVSVGQITQSFICGTNFKEVRPEFSVVFTVKEFDLSPQILISARNRFNSRCRPLLSLRYIDQRELAVYEAVIGGVSSLITHPIFDSLCRFVVLSFPFKLNYPINHLGLIPRYASFTVNKPRG